MLTFVRIAVFAMFVICVVMSLFGAALIAVSVMVPSVFGNNVPGETELLLFAPFVAVALAAVFGYLESVARRWPTPPQ